MPGENNLNGRVLNVLIDFDLIVNTELGLIRFIRENYQDNRAFDLDVLNKSDREILSLLYSRNHPNPLSVISTEDNMKDIDALYQSFFDQYREDIVNRSTSDKNIYQFVSLVGTAGHGFGTNAYIAIKDDFEKREIANHFKNCRFLFVNKSDKTEMKTKDVYYIRDYRFFTDNGIANDIIRKKIYMLPKKFSLDYFEDNDTSLTSRNVFMTIGKDYREDDENVRDYEEHS